MKISVRLEGGLGDHLLANRFVHAIKDKYPDSDIVAFSDTENNYKSINLLKDLYPNLYKETHVIERREDKNYKINTKFGEEIYPAHIDNIPKNVLSELLSYDKFYDLHIDSLKWLKYDFDWLRYYYFFPKPQIDLPSKYNNKNQYVLCHLYSRPNSPYNLENWYVLKLINKISEFINVLIVTEDDHINYYKDLFLNKNINFETSNSTIDIFAAAKECSAFIGIDSGIRYIPYHFSKPTFLFSKYCSQYGQVNYSHLIRWLIFKYNVFPMHYDINNITNILKNCIDEPASHLFPEIQSDIDLYIVDRKI